jgi:hypothetical protein
MAAPSSSSSPKEHKNDAQKEVVEVNADEVEIPVLTPEEEAVRPSCSPPLSPLTNDLTGSNRRVEQAESRSEHSLPIINLSIGPRDLPSRYSPFTTHSTLPARCRPLQHSSLPPKTR